MTKLSNSFVKNVLFFTLLLLPSFVAIKCFAIDQDATNRQLALEDIQQIVESAKQSEEVDLDVLEDRSLDSPCIVVVNGQ